MRNLLNLLILLIFISANAYSQTRINISSEKKTIDINNDKGELTISFEDGEIIEFIVNDTPVAKERYDDYQSIIDVFTEDDDKTPPPPPTPAATDSDDQGEKLYATMIQYLMDKDIIKSATIYDVELKRKYLKVAGKKIDQSIHAECLDIFDYIYGHKLNFESEVSIKRKGNNTSKTIRIID